ncbi:uncharacterized protein LOC144626495 [Crassostrea virginica]
MGNLLFLCVYVTGLFLTAEGNTSAQNEVCDLNELRSYRYIHCFDSKHIPINTRAASLNPNCVHEGTNCLVSCHHTRALSTWKKCIEGRWHGSDVSCKDSSQRKKSLRRIKRWWWSDGKENINSHSV